MTMATTDARCAVHPERHAEGICKRCGNYACAECNSAGLDSGVFCTPCAETVAESRYHVVPPWRFALFSVLTFSGYSVYWFWKNWSLIKRKDGSDIWPIPRAIFGGFTYFMLIEDINTQLTLRSSSRRLSTLHAFGFLVAGLLSRLPEPYDLIPAMGFVFLLPGVLAIQELASAAAIRQARWSLRHTLGVIFAVLFFALAMLGLAFPDETGGAVD